MEPAQFHNRILSPINRLPNFVLLTWIFELCISATSIALPLCDVHRHRKRQLASVSRHWRSVILHSPSLWATIKLAPTWSQSFVKTHVTRNATFSLAIEMGPWPPGRLVFRVILNLLVGCAHRWRSLVVQGDVNGFHLRELFNQMKSNSFPSLTHLSVEYIPEWLLNASAVSQFFYSALSSTGTSGAWRGVHWVAACTDTVRPYIPRAWGGPESSLMLQHLASESNSTHPLWLR